MALGIPRDEPLCRSRGGSPARDEQNRRSPMLVSREQVASNYGDFFQESTVMAEYAHILKQPPSGVYVLPSSASPFIWYGLLFVRSGLYENAVFKFTVFIPTNYPDGGCPRVDFQSGVFHPQVDYYTGELETKKEYQRWRRDVNCISHLLSYARSNFLDVDTRSPLNQEAADLYEQNREEFKRQVQESVESCRQVALSRDPSDVHAIDVGEWHSEVMKMAKKEIFDQEFKPAEDPSRVGLSWVQPGTFRPFSKQDTH